MMSDEMVGGQSRAFEPLPLCHPFIALASFAAQKYKQNQDGRE
jgi:hypothetical protein